VAGGPITTASDVYALGALLYRLLTGASPYAGAKEFPAGAARVIQEYEPPPASRAPDLPPRVRRALAGDLDNIVRKALERQPARRYRTVEEFAGDLDRYLAGRPVLARRASRWYRARKFVGRNRLPARRSRPH
jgi:serine/threonine protein kinase